MNFCRVFFVHCVLWSESWVTVTGITSQLPYHLKKDLNTEQHLIVDWTRFYSESHLTQLLLSHGLEVRQILPVHPISEDYRLSVLSAFYKAIVKGDPVRGAYPFTMYLVLDKAPRYEYRMAGMRGLHQVNVNIFEIKKKLRQLVSAMPAHLATSMGLGFHASDHISETKSNLKALGFYESLYKKRNFENMTEVFDSLNSVPSLTYIVLRNFENLPNDVVVDEHTDVDLLVSDYFLAKRILDGDAGYDNGADMIEDGGDKVLNYVSVGGQDVIFDLRYVGDNYYDMAMERALLTNRVEHRNFFIPRDEDLLYSKLYHALIHKPSISNTYKEYFEESGVWSESRDVLFSCLDEYMNKYGFRIVPPNDRMVGYYLL